MLFRLLSSPELFIIRERGPPVEIFPVSEFGPLLFPFIKFPLELSSPLERLFSLLLLPALLMIRVSEEPLPFLEMLPDSEFAPFPFPFIRFPFVSSFPLLILLFLLLSPELLMIRDNSRLLLLFKIFPD